MSQINTQITARAGITTTAGAELANRNVPAQPNIPTRVAPAAISPANLVSSVAPAAPETAATPVAVQVPPPFVPVVAEAIPMPVSSRYTGPDADKRALADFRAGVYSAGDIDQKTMMLINSGMQRENQSFQMLQQAIQMSTQQASTMSNLSKSAHDSAMVFVNALKA